MKIDRTGVILNTENYRACVAFYGEVLGLPLLFEFDRPGERLTCFDMGGAYLMVEPGGAARPEGKTPKTCPTKFRFNVRDVEAAAAELVARGVEVSVRKHDWGMTAEFLDPDGNRCALRSESDFGSR
ncbi:VOC family protein [Roseovarius pacificus]|uniref:VOC family protein n=1 Tax=Roseovarius pacificus TaxID=337701 RepID=UPI002A189444|nr:VOC family protein [Roseovarius pacificus]